MEFATLAERLQAAANRLRRAGAVHVTVGHRTIQMVTPEPHDVTYQLPTEQLYVEEAEMLAKELGY